MRRVLLGVSLLEMVCWMMLREDEATCSFMRRNSCVARKVWNCSCLLVTASKAGRPKGQATQARALGLKFLGEKRSIKI